jgi:hypothetical protein
VTSTDPLATGTLANLYLAQGHTERALDIAAQRLRDDPLDGAALAIRARVSAVRTATLELESIPGAVVVRWAVSTGAPPPAELHLVLATVRAARRPSPHFSSLRCAGPRGEAEVALNPGPASGAVALATLDEDRRVRILAAALLPSW